MDEGECIGVTCQLFPSLEEVEASLVLQERMKLNLLAV